MTVRITSTGRVFCIATIELPMSVGMAWGQLRDFRSSATHDPFHSAIEVHGGVPRAGARLTILHRHLLWSTVRVGRILKWQEGLGFAFSDLCQRDSSRAFPHVLRYQLEAVNQTFCKLHVVVGGRWTAPVWRPFAWLWLWWVFSQVVRTLENQLLRFALGMTWHERI